MRLPLFAIAGLPVIAGAAFAEPPKTAPAKPAETQQRPAGMMLASADAVQVPGGAPSSATAVKRRVSPRVTTCRCGEPQVDAQSQEQ